MDDKQFAAISKAISRESTRRGALARFAGGLAAALVGAKVASSDLAAKGNGKKRGKGKQRGGKKGRGAGALRAPSAVTCLACEDYTVEIVGGNPDQCKDNRVDPGDGAATGVFTSPCGCKIRWRVEVTAQGEVLTFEPEADAPVCTVGQIIVKGGPNGANIYTFDSPTLCASGLTTPGNDGEDKLFDVSHFDFCDVSCCKPTTCAAVGCTDGPICDGCGGTIDCPCVTNCPTGTDDGPNNTCDTSQGICVCTPDTCEDVSVECGTGFNNGCCGTFDCNCPTDCPAGTDDGPNNRCDGGKCVCDKDSCADLPAGVECGNNFADGCCGTFDCNCPTNCKGGDDGPNNTCTDAGICVCTSNTCASEGLKCTSAAQDDGCCGTFSCPCPTECPGGGANNRCTDDGCVCTRNTCESLGVTCGIHDDGCCGEIDCGPCPEECASCTIGYYSQNQCRVDTNVKLPCAADSPIGKKCFKTYGATAKGLLTARGGDVICAQAAAAFLNQKEFGKESCTDGIDVCKADNETLSKANEEGDCPLQGCGNSGNGKPDKKKKKR